jgi:hypothetical protein
VTLICKTLGAKSQKVSYLKCNSTPKQKLKKKVTSTSQTKKKMTAIFPSEGEGELPQLPKKKTSLKFEEWQMAILKT